REPGVDGIAARAPNTVEELRKLAPALLRAAVRRSCGARQGRCEFLERLAAAARTRQRVLECAPARIRGRRACVRQVGEALVALFEPREHAHQIIHAGLLEFLQRCAAAQGNCVATPECRGAGVGHGAGVLPLGGELGPDQLNLVPGVHSAALVLTSFAQFHTLFTSSAAAFSHVASCAGVTATSDAKYTS